jgi:hypothetical protein
MTPKQWKTVLKTAKRLQKEEEKIDNTLSAFCKAINPSNYNLFVEKGMLHGFLEAIDVLYGIDARQQIYYYLYEAPSVMKHSGKCIVKDSDGNEYNANNLSEYVKWLMSV